MCWDRGRGKRGGRDEMLDGDPCFCQLCIVCIVCVGGVV